MGAVCIFQLFFFPWARTVGEGRMLPLHRSEAAPCSHYDENGIAGI